LGAGVGGAALKSVPSSLNHAVLRAPPFPGLKEAQTAVLPPALPFPDGDARAALFENLRDARVGGRFWAEPANLTQPPEIILRPRTITDMSELAPDSRGRALWVSRDPALHPALALESAADWLADVDPWSVLSGAGSLLAHGDDEWVALARVAGVPVRVLSPGQFGAPGDDDEALDAKAAQALSIPMRDPFGDGWLSPHDAIALLAEWRRVIDANRGGNGEAIVAVCGMAWWKRSEIRRFLWLPGKQVQIISSPRKALALAAAKGGAVAVWPSRVSPALISEAQARGVPLVRIEDGFVRSVGLGSNLVPPSSIVVDRQGIHFDPRAPSDLETILAQTEFTPELCARARRLGETIVAAGISKYAASGSLHEAPTERPSDRRVILVPGQVEDDMSVLAGGGGLTSNLELLRRARGLEPDAEIWWRSHPDVDAGHRNGAVPDEAALKYADRIVRGGGMAPLLDVVDAVHVLTSLTGFEALMRGCEVTCHGAPFYSGWGLTRDLAQVPDRRGRKLSLEELIAGVLILYPRYLDPITGLPCPPEVLVARMAQNRMVNRQGWIGPVRRVQGRLMAYLRSHGGKNTSPDIAAPT